MKRWHLCCSYNFHHQRGGRWDVWALEDKSGDQTNNVLILPGFFSHEYYEVRSFPQSAARVLPIKQTVHLWGTIFSGGLINIWCFSECLWQQDGVSGSKWTAVWFSDPCWVNCRWLLRNDNDVFSCRSCHSGFYMWNKKEIKVIKFDTDAWDFHKNWLNTLWWHFFTSIQNGSGSPPPHFLSSLPLCPFFFMSYCLFGSDGMIPLTHQAFIIMNTCMGLNKKRGLSSSSSLRRRLRRVSPSSLLRLSVFILFFLSLSSYSALLLGEQRGNERGGVR